MKKHLKRVFLITGSMGLLLAAHTGWTQPMEMAPDSPGNGETREANCQDQFARYCTEQGLSWENCKRRAEDACKDLRREPGEGEAWVDDFWEMPSMGEALEDLQRDIGTPADENQPGSETPGEGIEDSQNAGSNPSEVLDGSTNGQGSIDNSLDTQSELPQGGSNQTGALPSNTEDPGTRQTDDTGSQENLDLMISGGGCSLSLAGTHTGPLQLLIGFFFGLIPFIGMGWRK